MIVGLKIVLQEIIYAELLFLVIMMLTSLILWKLLRTNHIQTKGVEALMTIGTIIILFGIPYIIMQTPFFIGLLIVAVISFVLTGLLFLLSIEFPQSIDN